MTDERPSPYTQAMDDLHFSADELADLKRVLTRALDSSAAENPRRAPAASTFEPESANRPRRHPRAPKRLATTLALGAALLLGAGGLAVAAGVGSLDLPKILESLYRIPADQVPDDTDLVTQHLASSTNNGVTVVLESVVDDGNMATCVFGITDTSGQVPDFFFNEDGSVRNVNFLHALAEVRPSKSSKPEYTASEGGSLPSYDPESSTLHMTVSLAFNRPSIDGHTVHLTLENLSLFDRTVVYPGVWTDAIKASALAFPQVKDQKLAGCQIAGMRGEQVGQSVGVVEAAQGQAARSPHSPQTLELHGRTRGAWGRNRQVQRLQQEGLARGAGRRPS